MKKWIALLFAGIMMVGIVGCGEKKEEGTTAPTTPTNTDNTKPADTAPAPSTDTPPAPSGG